MPGVYFIDDRPFTDAARIRAAVWAYGTSASGTGLTAAWWYGLAKYAPPVVEVTVPRVSNHRHRPNVRVRRRDLAPSDVVERHGLRVTALPLTVVEAAARHSGGIKIIDTAMQLHLSDLGQLWHAHLKHKGRHGSPRSRLLLQAADGGAHSEAERLLIRLLCAAGLTGWKANQRIGRWEVDVVFATARLAIEVDGLPFHSQADDFHRDRVKQNELFLLKWKVLRFTWLDLTEYPDRVIADIRQATQQ